MLTSLVRLNHRLTLPVLPLLLRWRCCILIALLSDHQCLAISKAAAATWDTSCFRPVRPAQRSRSCIQPLPSHALSHRTTLLNNALAACVCQAASMTLATSASHKTHPTRNPARAVWNGLACMRAACGLHGSACQLHCGATACGLHGAAAVLHNSMHISCMALLHACELHIWAAKPPACQLHLRHHRNKYAMP